MSNRRAPGQKLINFPAKEEFIAFVDSILPQLGYTERAQFVRDAMVEKIEAAIKRPVDRVLALPPGRIGKGPPRKITSQRRDQQRQKRNASSALPAADQAILDAAEKARDSRRGKP